jgi:hypothetical protein
VYISKQAKNKLKRYANTLRKIHKTRNRPAARKLLVQEGRGVILPLVLGPILSATASLVGELLGK